MQPAKQPDLDRQARTARYFKSPVATSLDELVSLKELSSTLSRGSKRRVTAGRTGPAVTKILGRGLDFAEVRGYQPGDDVRMIDWKVTARSGAAHTKLFVEERERPFFLVVDARSTMRFATQKMYKSVLAARLAALLGWSAVAHNDCVGGLVFTDQRHYEVKPQAGRRGLMSLFRALVKAQSEAAESTDAQGLAAQLLRLRQLAPSGCSVCLLSDFSGFDEASRAAVGPLLRRSDLVAVMLNDPLELSLPRAGRYGISQGSTRMTVSTQDTNSRSQYVEQQAQLIEDVSEFFSRRRARFLHAATSDDMPALATKLIRQLALSA